MIKVAVIGAGINGLTCALKVKQKYKNFKVVVISENFSPDTTGDGSGGLWNPYLVGNTPEQQIDKWCGETYKFLHKLWLEGGHNICLMPVYILSRDANICRPGWAKTVFGFQDLEEKQLEYLNRHYSANYMSGYTYTTFVSTASFLLGCVYNRFISLHGEIRKAEITSLDDPGLREYDVVINCTGLGAKYIVPDNNVFPIRGQIAKALASWINESVLDDRGNYIIPNAETCVLGGTHQEDDWNTNEDSKDTEAILNRCREMIPGLEYADIVKHWVGLRPARTEVRLESEIRHGKLFIHNYGHGGCGLTLFWGCATDVVKLLDAHLTKGKSKL